MSIIIGVEVDDGSIHKEENDTVELIASGYEWLCPTCARRILKSKSKKQ
jgi:hypothetical protein